MELTKQQRDRAAGVLLGQACGDALGVPYEFGPASADLKPVMKGGGLGPYEPGEYSDDTQMAICIARVAAQGFDLTEEAALDKVAGGFVNWMLNGASDIGNQTRAVLSAARNSRGLSRRSVSGVETKPRDNWAQLCRTAARDFTATHSRSAGNGALMRNGVIGLAALDDRNKTAEIARKVAELTHADPLVIDSCILHAEAVRVAVVEGRLDLFAGLDLVTDVDRWTDWITSARGVSPASIEANGSTFGALRAAWAAITSTDTGEPGHLERALVEAVRAGHDTDTVAAITGALLGARYGVSGIPAKWRRAVNGWDGGEGPNCRARDLVRFALLIVDPALVPVVLKGSDDRDSLLAQTPFDDGLFIGAQGADAHADAVVSLSRISNFDRPQWQGNGWGPRHPADHIEAWLLDSDDPDDHNDLAFALEDAADAVALLRAENKTVFLHCVHAHHRTPSVALVYAVKHRGLSVEDADAQVRAALGRNHIGGLLWETAHAVAARLETTNH